MEKEGEKKKYVVVNAKGCRLGRMEGATDSAPRVLDGLGRRMDETHDEHGRAVVKTCAWTSTRHKM